MPKCCKVKWGPENLRCMICGKYLKKGKFTPPEKIQDFT